MSVQPSIPIISTLLLFRLDHATSKLNLIAFHSSPIDFSWLLNFYPCNIPLFGDNFWSGVEHLSVSKSYITFSPVTSNIILVPLLQCNVNTLDKQNS